MKKIYSKLFLFAIAFTSILAGCSDDDSLSHTAVTPVGNLYAPDDAAFLFLGAQSSALFEWEAAKAEDNGVVLYEVVFDKEDGDFSNPIYKLPSEGNGIQRRLTISFADLSRIAEMAGIQPEGIGKLKWTVHSSKGINVQPSAVSRVIEVERPAGFPAPAELYLTGTATEAGDDLSKAILMKQTSPTTFEVYTSLKEGEYYFAERNTGTPATFFIENESLKADGKTTYSGEEKIYRIRVDFSNATTEISEVVSVALWFAPSNGFLFDLPYTGNGTWEAKNELITFAGSDERYKFRFTLENSDGSLVEEWYGSSNYDNPQRPDQTTPASFWYMTPIPVSQWDHTFKFASNVQDKEADIKVIFNTTVPEYTHSVTPN